MTIREIVEALSVTATAISRLCGTLSDYERGDRSVLEAPELASSIKECIDTLRAVRKSFEQALYVSIRQPSDERLDETTALRLKHVEEDIAKAAEQLDGLRLAVQFFEAPREQWSRGHEFVGVQNALVAAVTFARGDLLELERRLRALFRYYQAPFDNIEDQAGVSDGLLIRTLQHYDEERSGDVLHMSGAEGREPEPRRRPPPTAVRCNLVTVMFATDRPKIEESPALHIDYGSRLSGETLSFGVAEVSIPRGRRHKMGRLERPSIWKFQFREDPGKHVAILTSEEKELSTWVAIAQEHLAAADEHTALVFIHGFNVPFADAIRRAAQIGWDLQFRGVVTAFSWCSEGKTASYLADERNARLAAPRLLEFFEVLRKEVGISTIEVIAHSMGNLVLVEALRKLQSDSRSPTLNEVVFAAPDYDAVEFKRACREFQDKARRYTLYGSDTDRALAASKKIRSDYARAGDGGANVLVVDGVETIDASAVGEDLLGLGHSYFASDRTVLSDLFYLIRQSLSASQRSGMETRKLEGLDYWIMVP